MSIAKDLLRKEAYDKYHDLLKVSESFITKEDVKVLNDAFELVLNAEFEKKVDPNKINIIQTIEIATIAVEEIGLTTTSIISIFLQSIVEQELITIKEIEKKFGSLVAIIINGTIKLSNFQTGKVSAQSEKFRKFFLSIVDDIRIILLKIALRLYNLRNFDKYTETEQKIFLDEVAYLYIPIAHRLGLYNVKTDLEELSMKYTFPTVYQSIKNKIQESKIKQNKLLEDFIKPIQRELIKQGFDCEFKYRPKSVYSLWNKMKNQKLSFEEVFDLLAIRIIVESSLKKEKEDCWRIYSIVTDIYKPNPKRLRDWISTPKVSGYESLHTTVKGPGDRWIEVQIRTRRMDIIAEKGQAAHWRYKGFDSKKDVEGWLNQIQDILENPEQINFDETSDNRARKPVKIFLFTPNGDVKELPVGSTVLDFAYEIHSDIGSQCSGAKVNNKNVPIRHVLNNGDKVEIIISKNQKPKLDWLGFVITNKAKGRIKRAMLEDRYKEAEAGVEILKRKFKNWKIPYNEEIIDWIIKNYKFKNSVDLYYAIATEKVDPIDLKNFIGDTYNGKSFQKKQDIVEKTTEQDLKTQDFLVIDDKLKDVTYTLAKCCNPISGDTVFGFVTIGKGITIHRINCPNASQLLLKYQYRVIDVQWKDSLISTGSYVAKIRVDGKASMGVISDVTDFLSKNLKMNIHSLSVDSKKNGTFEAKIKIKVNDTAHLSELIHRLQKIDGVTKVVRETRFR